MGKKVPRATAKKGARGTPKKAAKIVQPMPSGFRMSQSSHLIVPETKLSSSNAIPASKLKRGLVTARRQLDETLSDILHNLTGDYEIAEIKLNASFSADGKFLGFGVGGAMTIEITVRPCRDD